MIVDVLFLRFSICTLSDILLITPPFTQLNTPYPATAYLKGFLNAKGISCFQMDLGIDVTLRLFEKESLAKVFQHAHEHDTIQSENALRMYSLREEYIRTIDFVILFLQGKNVTLARQICTENYLPQASRFAQLEDMEWAFGHMGMQDKAKHICTLYLEDLADFIVECVDEHFGFSRYAERLARSANSFDEIYNHLQQPLSFIDALTIDILEKSLNEHEPKLICFSVPFPGNLLSAFRCAQFIQNNFPNIKVAMGGGFPNTELRSIRDLRVFEFFDFIMLDDGELPLELVWESIKHPRDKSLLCRTFHLEAGELIYNDFTLKKDYKQAELGTPSYDDLSLDRYISVIEVANPMHSLWSDGRWNKLTMAHGCYWGKCTFCDISLDYIKSYEPLTAKLLVDRMEELIDQTGEYGFHFVDEAAPPALMRELAIEIIRRQLDVTWWTNIRFEKSFTYDLCRLLKASGCIAVSGGLEVASDRLLKLIDKGVTVEQVARVTRNFTEAGMMVHAYLMYGYPSQTVQETIDSLEMVRQLFELGIVQSGFWHQFALTAHSPIGIEPTNYGVQPHLNDITFANNDVAFTDVTGIDHNQFSFGLKKSLYNYMHGICFDYDLQEWFDFKIPRTTIDSNYIEGCLLEEQDLILKSNAKVVWLGPFPSTVSTKKQQVALHFHSRTDMLHVKLGKAKGEWVLQILEKVSVYNKSIMQLKEIKADYEHQFEDFEIFWFSKPMQKIKAFGLLLF